MTENDSTAPSRRRPPWGAIAACLLLIVLGAAGGFGWKLWHARAESQELLVQQDALIRRLGRQVGETEGQMEQLRERVADLADGNRRATDDIAALQSRADDLERALSGVNAALQGGRTRAQLIAVEQLLSIAGDRVQLLHDPHGAAQALQLAQDRIADLADPRLFEVRKAIADERAALLAVPQIDRAGASLALSSLIAQAPSLPPRERPPVPTGRVLTAAPDDASLSKDWLARARRRLGEMLDAVFVVRRTDKPVDRLPSPDEERLAAELLALRLESARIALLRDDTASFSGALGSAQQLLDADYQADAAGVQAASAEIERLRTLDLAPALPATGRSLGLLRAYLDGSGAASAAAPPR